MRRIVGIVLCFLFVLSGCAQADTNYLEEHGFVTAQPGSPMLQTESASTTPKPTLPPLKTPEAARQTPNAPGRPATPVPPEKPATPAPPGTPRPSAAQGTPAPSPEAGQATPSAPPATPATPSEPPATPTQPEQEEERQTLPQPPASTRLYFDEQPGFTANAAFTFKEGVYSRQDLEVLCKLLQLQQWEGLQSVFALFGTTLSPDVRMGEFAKDGVFAPALSVSTEPVLDESLGVAYITISQQKEEMSAEEDMLEESLAQQSDYVFFFRQEEGSYAPMSAVQLPNGEGASEQWLEKRGDTLFVVRRVSVKEYGGYCTRERWYDSENGQLKLDLVTAGHRESGAAQEAYLSDMDRDSYVLTNFGFTMQVAAEALVQYNAEAMFGSPTPVSLATGSVFTLYYDAASGRFYTQANRKEFFADTGHIQPGQYKYIFDEQLEQVKLIARTEQESAWAEACLQAPDWNASPRKLPGEDAREPLDAGGEQSLSVKPGYLFSQTTLEALAGDIEGMRGESLQDVLGRYHILTQPAEGDESAPLDIAWKGIKEIACKVNTYSAGGRAAVLDIRYRNGGEKGLFIVFVPDGGAWVPYGMYAYAPAKGSGVMEIAGTDGALLCTYESGQRNRQPVYTTIVVPYGSPAFRFVSGYTGKDGAVYAVQYRIAPGNTGYEAVLRATVQPKGEDRRAAYYDAPLWQDQHGWVMAAEDVALAQGEAEAQEAFAESIRQAAELRALQAAAQEQDIKE